MTYLYQSDFHGLLNRQIIHVSARPVLPVTNIRVLGLLGGNDHIGGGEKSGRSFAQHHENTPHFWVRMNRPSPPFVHVNCFYINVHPERLTSSLEERRSFFFFCTFERIFEVLKALHFSLTKADF